MKAEGADNEAIAGAVLIHAGCTLMVAGGTADDMAFIPVLVGVGYLIADLFSKSATAKAKESE